MHRSMLLALIVLCPTSLMGSGCKPEKVKPDAAPVDLPATSDHLAVLGAVNYLLDKDVDAGFTGYEPAGTQTSSFDPVELSDLKHAVVQKKTEFTLESKPVHPKPAVVNVKYQVDGAAQTGATVTATEGHFIAGVEATIDDYDGPVRLRVRAVQEDGSAPKITYP